MQQGDRIGVGWRKELAAGIFANLDRIDLVEVIADDYFSAPRAALDALRTLRAQVPVVLHGVGLGMASAFATDQRRASAMARLVARVQPEHWSEHLAFVRAGGVEIGHMAVPPRTPLSVEATAENLERVSRCVGARPLVENVATLVDPPASSLPEVDWVAGILEGSGCDLLLDLHNIHANGINHGYDPHDFLRRIPLQRVGMVHVAGGTWLDGPDGRPRLLDDHLHDVPDPVFALLEDLAAASPRPLTVVLERDGDYGTMASTLAELDALRAAVARGRTRAGAREQAR